MRRTRVREALPDARRQALTLTYFGGHTQREIAGLTDTPLGTVKTRMLAGMRRLRGVLDGISDTTTAHDSPRPNSDETPRTPP
jgi:RNA polymerase sigma-70 factor (ECF subfamily)